MNELGKYLRKRRSDLGLTQETVARELECTAIFISSLELGRSSLPANQLNNLARALMVDREEIIDLMRKDLISRFDEKVIPALKQ